MLVSTLDCTKWYNSMTYMKLKSLKKAAQSVSLEYLQSAWAVKKKALIGLVAFTCISLGYRKAKWWGWWY